MVDTDTPITEREFVKDPGPAFRRAEKGPVTIVDEDGNPSFILSIPRDPRPLPLD